MLAQKRILLVIGGGIAAYKALELIRLLRGAGAAVTPVMTKAAAEFVTPLSVSALAGAAGAMVAHLMPATVLRVVMPVILVAVAVFFAVKPGLSDLDRVERIKPAVFTFTAVPMIAAYDGFFGPGTGSFFMLAFVMLAGFGVLKATAHTKMLNFASNLGSLLVFASTGATWWAVGFAMAAAQVAGPALGARLAVRVGARLIKPLLVVTSTGMALRLIWQVWAG